MRNNRRPVVILSALFLALCHGSLAQQQPTPDSSSNQGQSQSSVESPTVQIPRTLKPIITNTSVSPADVSPKVDSAALSKERISFETETPTEFQQFVFQTTGQNLPLFGHKLFLDAPLTFAPVDRVPVTSEYVIGPGDEIVLRGWGQVDIDYRGVVDRQGNLFVPTVGNVSVAGIAFKDLQPLLKAAIGKYYHGFELSVALGQLRSIQIFVAGQARRPGSYTVSSLSTLVNAIFASGGPSNSGSMRHVQLKRGGKIVTEFDLYDLLIGGDKSKDAAVLPGDVIYYPPVGPMVAMIGSVNNPAIYEAKNDDTLGDLVQLGGGLTSVAMGAKATVERISNRSVRTVEEFPLDTPGLSRKVKDGDLITFRSLSARFDNAITIRGNVAAPGRYPWREGLRVRDLIPNREALMTRQFWSAHGDLGRTPLDYQSPPTSLRAAAPVIERPPTSTVAVGPVTTTAVAGTGQPSPAASSAPQASAPAPQAPAPLLPEHTTESNIAEQMRRVSPDINWDYAVVQRLNRENLTTNLIPFNLGKALSENNGTDNLLLEPGDIITIFSQADLAVPEQKRSKFVRLEGEFAAAGVYEVQPGETLRLLVERIGGFTPKAYLYGSEFTRESAREVQQRRLDELITQFEFEVERETSNKSANILSPEEAIALKDRAEAQRQLAARLRQVKATGRVVLGIKASDHSINAIPDVVLEDGDRFVVPFKPSIVNVVGAVYNNNSYIYRQGASFGYYLKRAGGGTRDADRKHSFIVRADGSVVSNSTSAGWFNGGVDSMRLLPGDTAVVPEKLDKVTFLKGLKDWSQILEQFGLGAAAIITLTR